MLFHSLTLLAAAFSFAGAQVLAPSVDPWYQTPQDIANYQPGELIRSRQVSNQLEPFIPLPVSVSVERVYQFLYRTTDSLGDPVAAASTLLIPYNSDPTKLLSYLIAYDSSNPDCSPSFTLQAGTAPGGLGGVFGANSTLSVDTPFLAAALNQGWWVITPDYEGLKAQYTAGLQAGYATLDSMRVALKEGPKVGLSTEAKYAMWGYSGGALAGGWAAELQPSYAPELKFEGAALGGQIASVGNSLIAINKGVFAGLAFGGVNGLYKAYPNLTTWVDKNIVPSKRAQLFDIANSCLVGASSKGAFQDLYSYFINGEASTQEAVPQSVLRWGGMLGLRGVPTTPLFMYKAVGDEISPSKDTDALVSTYCAQGATIQYNRDLIGEHITEAISGSASAFGWVADRLSGKPVANQGKCVTNNVSLTTIDDNTAELFGKEITAILKILLGGQLGL